ncbi:hypothetical protein E4U41_002033 [Claviceps citrina]|nr:hypothetical protein E4U41_002033 [Claviceps citrina]
MRTALLVLLAAGLVYAVCGLVRGLRRNIAVAKRSNLAYVVVPCNLMARHWLVIERVYARFVRLFPESWWDGWLDLMLADSCYHLDFQRFTRHGDMLLLVSPSSIIVQVSNAEAIGQIATQGERFPKPGHVYGPLKMFGENVLTSEGAVWRAHRRATSGTFTERNSALVFREVVVQTRGMIDSCWAGRRKPLTSMSADITRLTLHVIGRVGFGLRLLWPGQSLPPGSGAAAAKYASLDAPAGYTLSFVDTLTHLLDKILVLLLVPHWLLRMLPSKNARVAAAAYRDYVKYMDEMLDEKIEAVTGASPSQAAGQGMDLMGALARGSFGFGRGGLGDASERLGKAPAMTRDEILGNAFIMFVAGHESSANMIHLTLINLATNPAAQRRLQSDVDALVGDTDCSRWDYEDLMGPMATSAIGACLNETLRIVPPGPAIPKQVSPHSDQVLNIDGRRCMLPKASLIILYAIKAHEDPRHWPYQESTLRPGHDDLREYRPDRWFETQPGPRRRQSRDEDDEDDGSSIATPRSVTPTEPDGYDSDDGSDGFDRDRNRNRQGDAPFFRPRRGAFLPFSDGSRSCVGRRVAQVEIMTFLLVLFQRYSIELATEEWAGEEEVRGMDRRARTDVYRMAQAASRRTMAQAATVITLGLHGKTVPMRLVPRGEERFVDWVT